MVLSLLETKDFTKKGNLYTLKKSAYDKLKYYFADDLKYLRINISEEKVSIEFNTGYTTCLTEMTNFGKTRVTLPEIYEPMQEDEYIFEAVGCDLSEYVAWVLNNIILIT